jgi:hypothetical protein
VKVFIVHQHGQNVECVAAAAAAAATDTSKFAFLWIVQANIEGFYITEASYKNQI